MSEHGGNVLEMALKNGLDEREILDFSANINPLGMPESLKSAIRDGLALAERYPDPAYRRLHRSLAQWHGCPAECVLAGNGATELIHELVRYLRPRRALLLTPGFAEYRRALQRAECRIDEHAMSEDDGWQPDARLLARLDERPDCLFIATPNNPTGLMPDAALLLELAQRCQQQGTAVVVDEAFIDFLPEAPGLIPQLERFPRLYVLRSLTKFFAIPGLRLGYLVSADREAVRTMARLREPWTINAFAALAGEILPHDRDYIAATHRWLALERPRLERTLAAIPALRVWPSVANYLFLRCLRPEIDLQQELLTRHHILIRRCANYPGLDASHYRVAVRNREENHRLATALRQVLGHG